MPQWKKHFVPALKQAGRGLTALMFPNQCLVCRVFIPPGRTDPDQLTFWFCPDCLARGLPPFEPPHCTCCGKPLGSGGSHPCESCVLSPPLVQKVRGVFFYQDLVSAAVPLFKYRKKQGLAKVFGRLMFEAFERHFGASPPHIILPVPLHPKKLRQRGFNQSFLLAQGIFKCHTRKYGRLPLWQVDTQSLARIRHTRPQTGYDTARRRENLKNAFRVRRPDLVNGRTILLLDDVFTSGATCTEAAKALLKEGADRVDALVLARA